MKTLSLRAFAIDWWKNLDKVLKLKYFEDFKQEYFTIANNSEQLTGREIEIIHKKQIK